MTNTIPNVPRELKPVLAMILNALDRDAADGKQARAEMAAELRALLSAPSPAGVDGLAVSSPGWFSLVMNAAAELETASYSITDPDAKRVAQSGADYYRSKAKSAQVVCLSDAQAIIDGLRGENERIRLNIAEYNEAISCYQSERGQQAQRIGELEGLLRAESARVDFLDAYIVTADAPDTGKAAMLADSGTLRECIDAALSAGKEKQDEHS